jgi:hypothetical protein
MKQLSKNENFQKNVSLQIERNKNVEMNEEKMKNNLNKLHAQISFWRANNINALCFVNDNKEVNVIVPQTMHCIICHTKILNLNPKFQAKKG